MDGSVNPIAQAQATAQATGAQGQTQPTGDANSTFVGSADDLKDKAPEIYKAVLNAMMTRVIADARQHNDRLKEVIRENEQNNNRRS